jgi:hypothetical protein
MMDGSSPKDFQTIITKRAWKIHINKITKQREFDPVKLHIKGGNDEPTK